jgi:dienelactone hydrolase
MELAEPRTNYEYLLYVPSTYSDAYRWPLIVACHGTWPYDTAQLQMREWARFGEDRGIIVAAPTLSGTKGDFPPPPEKQIELQRRDEEAILAVVSEIKRRYAIAEDQVFMTGWSAGAYAILYTGLRNPDVFRAMTVRQGSFDERFTDVPEDRLDSWQRILVIYGKADFLREDSLAMLQWLRDRGMHPEPKEITGMHRRIDPSLPWRFFKDVVKKYPWLRVRARPVDTAKPLAIRFNLDAVPEASRQKWFFGDGAESYETSPVHTYERPGRYRVTVNVELEGGKMYARQRVIDVRPL